ncbi:glycoside hydrolase family 28 protein [Mangrovibacter yixingensis]|uniref:glycoside hydrolase family 28 protein n=1 Tax=Mangrovibacter yixingensis TaxID=1529639 RepID=UPI001CFA4B31|nr:glycosyl hydrolase family 28 protein [Mangrovibacter yixingensis]
MKKTLLAALCCAALSPVLSYAARPVTCSPVTFGGKGDGKTLNTQAIQQALQQCHDLGGGTVSLTPGIWLSGPLQLLSNTTLSVPKGAVLQASNQEGKFISAFIGRPAKANEAFIFASHASHVGLTGGGTLNGDGERTWWPDALAMRAKVRSGDKKAFTDRFPGIPVANGFPRPWFVEFNDVKQGRVDNLSLTNSPMWNIVIRNSADIAIHHVTITNPVTSPNTDGIDIVSSRNVTVSHADIHTGDDNIAIKSGLQPGTAGPSSNITVKDSVMRDGHGISVGSETANGIGKVTVQHITFLNTENGIRIKSARDRGNHIGPLVASHLTMTDVATPILVTDSYGGQSGALGHQEIAAITSAQVTATTPKIDGIQITDLKATGAHTAMILSGLPESVIEGVRFNNIHIASQTGILARYVNGDMRRVQVVASNGKSLEKGPAVSLEMR